MEVPPPNYPWRVDELSRRSGRSVDTIRYYERLGILTKGLKHGRVRYYGPLHLEELADIAALAEQGLRLRAIGPSRSPAEGDAGPTDDLADAGDAGDGGGPGSGGGPGGGGGSGDAGHPRGRGAERRLAERRSSDRRTVERRRMERRLQIDPAGG